MEIVMSVRDEAVAVKRQRLTDALAHGCDDVSAIEEHLDLPTALMRLVETNFRVSIEW